MSCRLCQRGFRTILILVVAAMLLATGCARRSASDLRDGSYVGTTPSESISKGTADNTGSPPSGGTSGSTTVDRKIIFNASLSVEVEDAEKALTACTSIAAAQGGFIAQSSLQKNSAYVEASIVLRIPSAKIATAMDEVVKLGTVTGRSSGSEDVTSQYIDVEARLKVLRAEEEQLLTFLKKATKIEEMLAVQAQLRSVRTEIEQLEGQQRYLDNATSLATLTVTLRQTLATFVAPRGFGSAFGQSLVRFGHSLAAFWTWLGGSLVYLVFWGLLIWGILWLVLRVLFGRRRRRTAPQS